MRQALGPGALGRPRGIGWRGRWEGVSGWGTHVNPWLIISMYDKTHYNKKKCQVNMDILHLGQATLLHPGVRVLGEVALEK